MYELEPLSNCRQFSLHGNEVLKGGTEVGKWHPEQSRIEWRWDRLGVNAALVAMAEREAQRWDSWAYDERGELSRRSGSDSKRFTVAGWLERYPNIKAACHEAGISLNFRDHTMLDIGGSGKDMVYWLKDKPKRIDQVEVSPESQRICHKRVNDVSEGSNEIPIYYHTIPAEQLPFDEGVFDFVFSRSTLHHCERPKVFQEIIRVMKPGGALLFVEPHLSRPIHLLMRLKRVILKQDRGSDNPLQPQEIEKLKKALSFPGIERATYYNRSLLSHLAIGKNREDWGRAYRPLAMQVCFLAKKS